MHTFVAILWNDNISILPYSLQGLYPQKNACSAADLCDDRFLAKPVAAVARRGGTTATLDALNKYFRISQMPIAGSTYWNMVHGNVAEDVPCDAEGVQTMHNLASNMIWMMRCFAIGKKSGVPYPDTETGARTNFIRR